MADRFDAWAEEVLRNLGPFAPGDLLSSLSEDKREAQTRAWVRVRYLATALRKAYAEGQQHQPRRHRWRDELGVARDPSSSLWVNDKLTCMDCGEKLVPIAISSVQGDEALQRALLAPCPGDIEHPDHQFIPQLDGGVDGVLVCAHCGVRHG